MATFKATCSPACPDPNLPARSASSHGTIAAIAFSLLLTGTSGFAAETAPSNPTQGAAQGPRLFKLKTWPPSKAAHAAATDSVTENDPLAAYTQVRSASFAGWSPAGIYVLTRMGPFPQMHRVAEPMADRRQETFFKRRVDQWCVNPIPSRREALITLDQGGDEAYALKLLDLATGRSCSLACPPGRVTSVLWNDSGTAFIYSHTPAGTDRWDIRRGGPDGRDTLLLRRPGTWIPMDWTPDGSAVVLQRYVSSSESELHILSLPGGKVTRILPGEPAQYLDHAAWVRMGETGKTLGLAFTSDRDGAFHRVYMLGRGEDKPKALSPPAPWDVEWVAAGGDRRTLIFSLNEQGVSALHAVKPGVTSASGSRLPDIPKGIIEGVVFDPTGKQFGFTVNAAAFPGDAFTYRLSHKRSIRWTESETAGLPRQGFREPELIQYPSFDSVGGAPRMIPAWLYSPAPRPIAEVAPIPVLIQIHGGPELQARAGFDPFVQYLAGRMGVAVILPNVRGSSGYGKDWLKADDGLLRMGAVKDIGALLDWIKTRPDLDPAKVAVAGRSYGGFMALASLVRYGDRLRGGISTVGITHFPTFLKETSGYRRDLRRVEYGDERNPRMAAFLDSISPAARLDRLRKPLLLAHGRNDPRVPYSESVRLYDALKSKKIPVWLLTFNQEGHAFRSEASQLIHNRVMAAFLARQLGMVESPGP